MCGIVAVLRRSSGRMPPDGAHLLDELEQAVATLATVGTVGGADQEVARVAARVEDVDALLKGSPGVRALLGDRALFVGVEHHVEQLQLATDRVEAALDANAADLSTVELEDVNAALVRLKDAVWAVGHDRLRTARAVADLCGSDLAPSAIEAFTSVQVALSALDRLEVRGRDSAGLHLFVHHHGLDLDDPAIARLLDERRDPLFGSRAVRRAGDSLSFVYKAAAEIGELGDNTATLRRADPRRRPPAPGGRSRDLPGRRAGAHPVGERRHHLGSQRAPRQQRGGRARRRAVRHRYVYWESDMRLHPTRPSGPPSAVSGTPSRRGLLGVLLVAQLMVILDISAVNVALPDMAADLGIRGGSIGWVITAIH